MITTAFLVTTLILNILNLAYNIFLVAAAGENKNPISGIIIFGILIMITWNIFAIIYR